MNVSNRIKIVKKFLNHLTSKRNIQHYDAYLHPDVMIHDSILGTAVHSLQEVKRIDLDQIPACQESFEIEEAFEFQSRIFVRWVSKIKAQIPTASIKNIFGLSIFKFDGDKIIEIWHYWDRLALLGKLGKTLLKFDMPQQVENYDLSNEEPEQYMSLRALLTNRERDCLKALLEGKTAKDTAKVYGISSRTVEQYFENMKAKFKCPTKRDLFKIAKVLEALKLL